MNDGFRRLDPLDGEKLGHMAYHASEKGNAGNTVRVMEFIKRGFGTIADDLTL